MRLILLLLLVVLVSACVDPYVYSPGSVQKYYVIYGNITDQPGPYTIKIATSSSLDRSSLSEDVTGATVSITDDAGANEKLLDVGGGQYRTSWLQGQVGHTYVLHVTTPDGQVFQSDPEKIIPVGDLSDFHAEFAMNVDSTNVVQRDAANGFNLFADADFTPEQEGHVLWKWSATFEFTTAPEKKGYWTGTKIWVPTPEVCSGYYSDRGRLVQFAECTCCNCWFTFYNDKPLISDVSNIHDNKLTKAPVGFIAVQGRFTEKVVVILKQESVSPTVYKFWQSVTDASNLGSSLFQSPPAQTKGNIRAVDENNHGYVLGLFSASSVRSDTLQILRDQIPYTPDARFASTTSCLGTFLTNNTNIKPAWY